MGALRCHFEIVSATPTLIVLRDTGYRRMTVTNDVEEVVAYLVRNSYLAPTQRLEYIDSEGMRDEILVNDGQFAGFTLHNEAVPRQPMDGAQAPPLSLQ